jgi:hypothetical protein
VEQVTNLNPRVRSEKTVSINKHRLGREWHFHLLGESAIRRKSLQAPPALSKTDFINFLSVDSGYNLLHTFSKEFLCASLFLASRLIPYEALSR